MHDLELWLPEQFAEDERIALAASNRSWIEQDNIIELYPEREDDGFLGFPTRKDARHAANWQPERALAEIRSKRAMLDSIVGERHAVVEDGWYTCPAATEEQDGGACYDEDREGGPCDCGRDSRVAQQLWIMTMPYTKRPGFKASWSPVV